MKFKLNIQDVNIFVEYFRKILNTKINIQKWLL